MKKEKKYYLSADKEWLLKNYPKITLKELCEGKMLLDKPFKEETGGDKNSINKKSCNPR